MARPKGSKNKITNELKNEIKELLDLNVVKIQTELNELKGRPFIECYLKLLEYVIPKAKELETLTADYQPPKIIIEYVNE